MSMDMCAKESVGQSNFFYNKSTISDKFYVNCMVKMQLAFKAFALNSTFAVEWAGRWKLLCLMSQTRNLSVQLSKLTRINVFQYIIFNRMCFIFNRIVLLHWNSCLLKLTFCHHLLISFKPLFCLLSFFPLFFCSFLTQMKNVSPCNDQCQVGQPTVHMRQKV